MTILTELARGTVEWSDDDQTGLTIPEAVPGIDIEEFYVPDHVEDYEDAAAELRADRLEYLSQFEDLDETIIDATY